MPKQSSDLDALLLEPRSQPFLQNRQSLGQGLRLVVLEDLPAVVQCPGDEAETFLVADLDVPVPDSLGDGWEQFIDAPLLLGRLDHAGSVPLPNSLEVAGVGFLNLGEVPLD